MVTASSASSSYADYGYESTFGGGVSGNGIKFGKEVKVTGLEFKNNQIPLGQLYSPEIESFAYGRNDGKCSVDYVVSNPWFFQSILGVSVPTNAGGVYSHTWNSNPTTTPTMRDIKSMALKLGFKVNTDYKRTAVGVVCPSLSLKMSLNETVKATQELVWGEETVNQVFAAPTGVEMAGAIPYTFVHASITNPLTGNTLASVQSFDLNINSNAELIYGMGSKLSVDAYRKILELTGKISIVLYDSDFLESVYNRAEAANDLVVTISNGGSGTALRSIVMTFTGCSFSSHDSAGVEPGELLLENLDFQCKHVTVVAKNTTTVIPP